MNRCGQRLILVLVILSIVMAARGLAEITTAREAQEYRKGGQPVVPQPDGLIVCEAEEFRIDKTSDGGWKAKNWGENYYAATFANTFLSRKAFLGAESQCTESTASVTVDVKEAGKYLVLVRYEAAYRFETQFRVRIEQNGEKVFDRLYGARDNIKIWAFSEKLKKEVGWYWGAVENVVWEGHDAYGQLEPGTAKISLVVGKQKAPAARRNVDLVMLTTDEAQVKSRIEKERYLPLDGMLTQAGDVFMRLHNQEDGAAMNLTVPAGTQHSPYWVHMRNWKPVTVLAGPGESTGWTDVGGVLDTLNDGQWTLTATPKEKGNPLHYKIEFGVRTAAGNIEKISDFESRTQTMALAFHADTRYSRLLRDVDHVLYDLVGYLEEQPTRGRLPKRTLIYGYTFDKRKDDAEYNNTVQKLADMFALDLVGNMSRKGIARGYVDLRGKTPGQLEDYCKELGEKAKNVAVVSLGDEIGLGSPSGADANEQFRNWLKQQGLKPRDVLPIAGNDWSKIIYNPKYVADYAKGTPGLYYWSRRYQHHYGIVSIKAKTDALRKHLPNAGVGANFSPHHGGALHAYLGEVHKWVTLFRQDGMTLPWSEDYIWQLPVGSPQMNFINLDLSRAGLRHRPNGKILYYVMPHWPGNTPRMWRRQFYGDIAHGMKIVDLFEFRPVQAAYTENHVSLPEMYLEIRDSFREMGLFEDIMQDGGVRPGIAGLWFSQTADIWHNYYQSMSAGKRSLYISILHNQIPLDFVVEEDAADGTLDQYKVVYLTDINVSNAASEGIEKWVRKGGTLFVTAGAGMFDELNQPNKVLREVLGVEQQLLERPEGRQVGFIKQDLPFSDPIDTVTMKADGATIPVTCAKSRITVKNGEIIGTFRDGSPAVVSGKYGKGKAVYCAFLPGLSYFKPAIPKRPVDRGSTDDAMAHLMPTGGNEAALKLVGSPIEEQDLPVVCSEPLVESSIIDSKHGMLVVLGNWSEGPVKNLAVRVQGKTAKKIELASGGEVKVDKQDGRIVYTLDLDVADALILR